MQGKDKRSGKENTAITEALRSQASFSMCSASEIAELVEKIRNEPMPDSVAQTWVNRDTRIERRRFPFSWRPFENSQLVLDIIEIARAKDSVPWWHRWMFNVSGVYVQRNLSSDTYEWAAGLETQPFLIFEGDKEQNSIVVIRYQRGSWEHHIPAMRVKADRIVKAIQEQNFEAYWDALLKDTV